ncbi:uncharacterized HTH-type transcriptional regulator yisR [Levilactobacillus brevis KB290]|uniref:Uncharacterized HTH-type transcriptional regulator yisR n=1 Tax=Levilactobacillus brevis KB290 TaxID=1001583 RepID=M5AAR4_LEVBR|nr:uncharacterized HTH-type transcriptional regulator yisR [Levilactobacillus brevis KB290]
MVGETNSTIAPKIGRISRLIGSILGKNTGEF